MVARGKTKTYSSDVEPSDRWKTLTVRVEKVNHPAPGDNFSLGLFGVKGEDWFDVRELSLFIGRLP